MPSRIKFAPLGRSRSSKRLAGRSIIQSGAFAPNDDRKRRPLQPIFHGVEDTAARSADSRLTMSVLREMSS